MVIFTAFMLATASGAASAAAQSAPPKGNPARFFDASDYPVEALRLKQEGRVVVTLAVDRTGKVVSCAVTGSSGSQALDRGTCDIALARVTFEPATDENGAATTSNVTVPVRWTLPRAAVEIGSGPPLKLSLDVVVTVDAAGKVLRCETIGDEALTGPDACAPFPVGEDSDYHWTRNGTPIGGKVHHRSILEFEYDP